MTNVIGIDLSLTSTGIAHTDGHVTSVRTVKSTGKKDATLNTRWERLNTITQDIVAGTPPDAIIIIEGPSFGQARQGGQHDRAGLWWKVVDEFSIRGNVVVEVPPACRAKYGTGKGNAAKDAVLAAVVRRYPDVMVDGNDQADALILAAMGSRWLHQPIDTGLPLTHTAGMTKVAWPELTGAPY